MVKQFYYLSSIGALNAPEDSVLGRSFSQFVERWGPVSNQQFRQLEKETVQ